MRSLLVAVLLAASAPLLSAANAPPPAEAGVDKVLQQLDETGKNLKEFSAKLKLTATDNNLADQTMETGTIRFQKKSDGSARIHVVFTLRINPDTRKGYPEKKEYLLDGPWLIDRNYQTRNEVKRQVLRAGQKMDLFKLGQGPLPLPVGQDPKSVHQVFDVKEIPPAKDDPADCAHLELMPKPGTEMATKFFSLDIWVNQKNHMPVRVDNTDPKKKTTQSTELSDIVLNPPDGISDADFQLPDIDNQNWNRHVESLND